MRSFENGRLVVESSLEPGLGDSVAVNGVCLTVVDASNGALSFDLLDETIARAKPFGAQVNLEPALRAGDQFGGHYVQGHVDGVGRIQSVEAEGEGLRVFVEAPAEVLRYCVEKGSITVEGVSLTIASLGEDSFGVALIPHTRAATTLGGAREGDDVNLEVDVVAKHVERLVQPQ